MDTDQLFNTILKNTYTIHSLQSRVRVLKKYLNNRFFNPDAADAKAEPEVGQGEEESWLDQFDKTIFDALKGDQSVALISQIEAKIRQLKVLTLYVAFLPTPDQVNQIGQKMRLEFGEGMIMDLKVNPELVAGCRLVWNGVIKDYSLAGRIAEQKQQVLTLFKQYMDK